MFAEPQQKNVSQLQSPQSQSPHIQPKLEVGAKDDPQEKEADAVADSVMRMSESSGAAGDATGVKAQQESPMARLLRRHPDAPRPQIIHRLADAPKALPVQRAPAAIQGPASPALRKKEDEENAIAKAPEHGAILRMHDADEETVQKKEDEESVMKMDDEEGLQKKEDEESVMKMDDGGKGGTAPAAVEQGIQSGKGQGNPLPENVQQDIGGKMGADLSDVRVHTGSNAHEMSTAINAKAFTHGQDVYFKNGNYDTSSSSGKKLLTHELTHTQQQSARGGGGMNRKIQRFESNEHRKMGDEGSGGKQIVLSPYFTISYGDMTALAGDWFGSVEEITELAKKRGKVTFGKTVEDILSYGNKYQYFNQPGTVDEIKYAVVVGIHGKTNYKNIFGAEVPKKVDARAKLLLQRNWDHFTNPRAGDAQLAHKDKLNLRENDFPLNNATAYRDNHERAIQEAVKAGKNNSGLNTAMLYESFASHFLTDAYASGHIRAERFDIAKYWNEKYPMFYFNMLRWIAEKMAQHIQKNKYYGLTKHFVFGQVVDTLNEMLGSDPETLLGDIIGGAIHDLDNKRGVASKVDKAQKAVRLFGDGQVLDDQDRLLAQGMETFNLVTAAVKVSLKDITAAYEKGKNGQDVNSVLKSLQTKDLYKAEQLWPAAVSDTDPLQKESPAVKWKADTYEKLIELADVKDAIKLLLDEKTKTIKDSVTFDEDYKKTAFEESVVTNLQGDAGIESLKQIIHYYPGIILDLSGFFGSDDDDEAYDYYKETKDRSALGSLTSKQREGLIKKALSGPTVGDDDVMIADILSNTPEADVYDIITGLDEDGYTGWAWIYDDLSGQELEDVIRKAGPAYWKQATFDEKWNECYRMIGITNVYFPGIASLSDFENKVVMVILRSDKTKIENQLLNVDFQFEKVLKSAYKYEIRELVTP